MSLWAIDKDWQVTKRAEKQKDTVQEDFKMKSKPAITQKVSVSPADDESCLSGVDPESDPSPSWKSLLYGYSQNTSLHGVKYIGEQSRFIVRRILWLVIVSSALGFFIFYSYSRISFYFQFTKNVNVEVNYLQKVRFPAVTFCNQNAFRMTAVANNDWYDMIKAVFYPPSSQEKRNCTADDEFKCVSNYICIPLKARCDGFPDCEDASDEINCDPCPLLATSGSQTLTSQLPELVGRLFRLQPNTWPTSPVYVSLDSPPVILYTDGTRWRFGEHYGEDQYFAYVNDGAHAPQLITSTWKVNVSGSWNEASDLKIACEIPYKELLIQKPYVIDSNLDLSTLYETAAHQQQDFIQNCLWKGNPCEEGSIRKKLTDMGVCFTFNSSDMFIEQSGPGYGLSLTVNIEQYEYTKNTDDGIGIKLLMHEPDDVPMMSERGTAVSPGLYSFISVETTAVKNLEPPWGTCGEKYLKYFDSYSVSKCVSECETGLVEGSCQCRDLQMPHKEGKPQICDVRQYVDCTKPQLDELRAAGNYCDCPTPCQKDEYVPTTSFSIVLGGNSNPQDEKTHALQKKVFNAREITYRVVRRKRMATRKVFHLINKYTARMTTFARATVEHLRWENAQVSAQMLNAKADCVWLRELLTRVKQDVRELVVRPTAAFRETLWNAAVAKAKEFEKTVDSTLAAIDENTVFDAETALYFARQNDSLWQSYRTLRSSLDLLRDPMQNNLYQSVDSLPDQLHLRLQKRLFDALRPDVGYACAWCSDASGTPMTSILKDRVKASVGSALAGSLTSAGTKLDLAYDLYLADLWVTNVTQDVYAANVTRCRHLIRTTSASLEGALRAVDRASADAEEMTSLLDDLLHYTWNVQCLARLSKLVDQYDGNRLVLDGQLASFLDQLDASNGAFLANQRSYTNGTMHLTDVATEQNTDVVLTGLTSYRLRLDVSLRERALLVHTIRGQIDQIYYLFMMQLDHAHLAANSAYWKHFGITSPAAVVPEVRAIDGVPVLSSRYSMVPNDAANSFWQNWADYLNLTTENLVKQSEDLSTALNSGREYFQAYVKGNELDEAFYSKNFLQVELFYKELTERKVSQQKAYDFENLLSEIGGLMGLMLGASVLSIFEMLDLLLYNCFRKCCDMLATSRVHPERRNHWKDDEDPDKHSLSMI